MRNILKDKKIEKTFASAQEKVKTNLTNMRVQTRVEVPKFLQGIQLGLREVNLILTIYMSIVAIMKVITRQEEAATKVWRTLLLEIELFVTRMLSAIETFIKEIPTQDGVEISSEVTKIISAIKELESKDDDDNESDKVSDIFKDRDIKTSSDDEKYW